MKHTKALVGLMALFLAGLVVGCGDLESPTEVPIVDSPPPNWRVPQDRPSGRPPEATPESAASVPEEPPA